MCVFKNTDSKNICAFIVFKAESKLRHKETNVGGFSSKTKNAVFWGSKMVLFESQISNLYFCVCSLNKKKILAYFHQKILIFGPPGIFWKWKLGRACVPKFWNLTSKIIPDLWLLDLFCPINTNFHTSPYTVLSRSSFISVQWKVYANLPNLKQLLWNDQAVGELKGYISIE